MAASEHSEPEAQLTVINNLSGVFPSPTRHWPGMTHALTGKVPSSWETVQVVERSQCWSQTFLNCSSDPTVAGYVALDKFLNLPEKGSKNAFLTGFL